MKRRNNHEPSPLDVFTNPGNQYVWTSIKGKYVSSKNPNYNRPLLFVEATVHVSAEVGSPEPGVCGNCKAPTPPFDIKDGEVLLFLLANHDGSRLLFADSENCYHERDCYPVPGWGTRRDAEGESGLLCADCRAAASAALKARRPKK